jgi:hypothetical protein
MLYFDPPFVLNENVKAIEIDDDVPKTGETVHLAGM